MVKKKKKWYNENKKRKGVHHMKYLENLNLGEIEALEKLSALIKSGKVKIVPEKEVLEVAQGEKAAENQTGKKVLWCLAIIGAVAAVAAIAVAVYKILTPEKLDDFDDDFDDDFFNDTEEEKKVEDEVTEEKEEPEKDIVAAVEEAIESKEDEVEDEIVEEKEDVIEDAAQEAEENEAEEVEVEKIAEEE